MRIHFTTLYVLSAVTLCFLCSCSTNRIYRAYHINIDTLNTNDIIHIPTGIKVSREQMITFISESRIVYIGETHDNINSHRVQLEIIKGLWELHSGEIAVGVEMFQKQYQDVLDSWSEGKLTEKEFLEKGRWHENWSMNYAYYKDIFNFVRDKKIPIIGLNVSKKLKRAILMNGIENLPDTMKKEIPELDLSDPYHRAATKAYFGGHKISKKNFEKFYFIQCLWDESMAENIARFLKNDDHRGTYLIVLAGAQHIRYGYGIPRRVFRRLPVSYVSILPSEILPRQGSLKEAMDHNRLMNVDIPEIDLLPADFYWFITYRNLEE